MYFKHGPVCVAQLMQRFATDCMCHWCKMILHFRETLGSGDVAKLVECLTSTCKALIPALHKLPMAIYAYNIAPGKWKQDDQKLVVILNYRVSLRQV